MGRSSRVPSLPDAGAELDVIEQTMPVEVCTFANKDAFQAKMAEAELKDKLIVIDFTATWCGPCKAIKPKYEALADTYSSVAFWSIDVDENEVSVLYNRSHWRSIQLILRHKDLCGELRINSMPTFQYWKNGGKVAEFSGADAIQLEEYVKKFSS